ncbi:hypothetical protein GCM10027275_55540 [Rhabdobacter roseus]
MGLASGLVVFVICLSGTIYVYNTEIREIASPELYRVEPLAERLPAEELIKHVKASTGGKVLSLKVPHDPARSYQVTVRPAEEKKDAEPGSEPKRGDGKRDEAEAKTEKSGEAPQRKETENSARDKPKEGESRRSGGPAGPGAGPGGPGGRGIAYLVNPYTADILGEARAKTATSEFMQTMFSLHRWLLLDKIEEPLLGELPNRKLGSYISGWATILFTLGVLTGIVIWFPQKVKNWRQGLSVKWSGNWKRINHDLHNTLGFYACILLFLMGVTGPFFSFDWYREGLRKTLGTYQPEDAPRPEPPQSQPPAPGQQALVLSIADYLAAADEVLAYPGDYTLTLPTDSTAAVTISKNRTGFFAPAAADRLLLDQYTGRVLSVEVFRDKPFNERVSGSIKALHLGDVYGPFSKLLYFIACLIATSLPITGTLIWLNKMKPKKAKKSSEKVLVD